MVVIIVILDELDVVKVLKIERMRWLGHLSRMQELHLCRRLILLKPEGTSHVRKPNLRVLESVERDLKNMGMKSWRCNLQDREQLRTILE